MSCGNRPPFVLGNCWKGEVWPVCAAYLDCITGNVHLWGSGSVGRREEESFVAVGCPAALVQDLADQKLDTSNITGEKSFQGGEMRKIDEDL